MRILSVSLLSLLFLTGVPTLGLCQNPVRARTEAGKDVFLYPDGKWKYVEENKAPSSERKNHDKPGTSNTPFKTARGSFEIWVNEGKWIRTADEPGKMTFSLKTGDAYVLVISEEIAITTLALKEMAIENARKASSDFLLVVEESRTVNGREVTSMKFNSTIKSMQFTYYAYYYGGKEGTIQVLCYTGQNLFAKYEREFTEFLDGLTIQ